VANNLRLTTFADVDLSDPFFDSLKNQYTGFGGWFSRKAAANEPVFVIDDDEGGGLQGFLYLKMEEGAITDVNPHLPPARRLKVGTLKVIAHGTKLGERVVKKIFDHAVAEKVEEIYVTVFDTHASLISLVKRYGFEEIGSKTTKDGTELVLLRSMKAQTGDIVEDYPFVHLQDRKFYLLAVYPEYHTSLFPDSKLYNESPDIVTDVSHTNTIHKVYIGGVSLTRMNRGDAVIIYRTTDRKGHARYRSVATSICVVEETKSRKDFSDVEEFVSYCSPHSVFPEDWLRERFKDGKRLFVARMTYNAAFKKRPNREKLLDDVGISTSPQWDFRRLTRDQFDAIVQLGEVPDDILIG
jgi:hypothetical protein